MVVLRRQPPRALQEILLMVIQVLINLGDLAGAATLLDEARRLVDLELDDDSAGTRSTRPVRYPRRGRSRIMPLADPLTERELEVLRLLRGTLPLREIAGELRLSPNTVKTHAHAVYRKLGVASRQRAVLTGRELGLI